MPTKMFEPCALGGCRREGERDLKVAFVENGPVLALRVCRQDYEKIMTGATDGLSIGGPKFSATLIPEAKRG